MVGRIIDESDPLGFIEDLIVPIATPLFFIIIITGCLWLIWKRLT